MRKPILLLMVISLTGCAGFNNAQVSVNAIAAPDAGNYKAYFIMPPDEKLKGLEFDQYAFQVEQVLAQKGYTRRNDGRLADLFIFLDTKVGDAQTQTHSGVIPQWGQTGYSGAQTYGSFSGNQFQSNTYYTPSYGVTGYMPYSNTVTYYPLGFSLAAWTRVADKNDFKQVWVTTVTGRSASGDLRSAFPHLLRAAAPYIAGDTHGIKKIVLSPN